MATPSTGGTEGKQVSRLPYRKVEVTRKKESLHPTVDREFSKRYDNPYAQKSRAVSDTDEQFANDNYLDEEAFDNSIQPNDGRGGRVVTKTSTIKREIVTSPKRILKKKMAAMRAAWMIIGTCWIIYVGQILFWMFGIVGLGLEYGEITAGDIYGGNVVTRFVVDIFSAAIPGDYIFAIGWVISSTLAVVQLFIALGIFYLNRVNALRGEGLKNFIFTAAICFMPLGLIPWALFWVIDVILKAGKK